VTLLVFCLILFSGTCSVTGQIFFKHAMSGHVRSGKPRRSLNLAAGVLAMTVGFFTWLTLLQRFNLSYLYPFEGLDNVILAFGAWLFLQERMTSELWLGMILICFGTMLISVT
jgi:drug/metabolite transporter (DMT)-like permease